MRIGSHSGKMPYNLHEWLLVYIVKKVDIMRVTTVALEMGRVFKGVQVFSEELISERGTNII